MSSASDQTTRRVLDAARTLFARHGFQRTSMADVAKEAAVSRATLYLRFCDKRSVFEALAESLVDSALTAAGSAWNPAAALADNLEATVLAKDLPLYRLLHASPHGAELLAVDAGLTRAHAERLDHGFAALLAERAADAARGGADLSAFDGPDGFSLFLAATTAGLKHEARTEAAYRDAVRRLCIVTARAMTSSAGA